MPTQSFMIHRHGARYALKKPEHNAIWPSENKFWRCHIGKLTPVGVIQMCKLGQFFRQRYPWATVANTVILSTHRSRALESAWSFVLGLFPDTPVKFETIKSYQTCTGEICCGRDICCIHYYHKGDDLIFGQGDPSMAYKINVNESPLLQELTTTPEVASLIDRLTQQGYFRIRRDPVTTIAKLKDIHAQLCIDSQLQIPDAGSLVGKYALTSTEQDLIRQIGNEVISRRLVPSSDRIAHGAYNEYQGKGIIQNIHQSMVDWNQQQDEFRVFSCHDTNLIALMSLLGIKIDCPDFAGYILIERTVNPDVRSHPGGILSLLDVVSVYYCPSPFDDTHIFTPKIWSPLDQRETFIRWDDLQNGIFATTDFISLFQTRHLDL